MGKKLLGAAWVVFLFSVFVVFFLSIEKQRTYEGALVTTQTSDVWVLMVDETEAVVYAKVVSEEFFVLRNVNTGQVISGTASEIPLGWSSDQYFSAADTITTGKWVIENDSAVTLRIRSDDGSSLGVRQIKRAGSVFAELVLLSAFAIIMWLFATLLAFLYQLQKV